MRRETPTRRFGFQPPTVQTGKAYHIRLAWPNAADARHGWRLSVGEGLWEQGLPAMNDNAVQLLHRGAAIAGKPCSHRDFIQPRG
nr:hypothetical protein C1892_01555 [Pseudomonas sp. MPBD7-1]